MGDPCFPSVNCHNVGNGSFECESCPDGFEGDGQTCTDINEVLCKSMDFQLSSHCTLTNQNKPKKNQSQLQFKLRNGVKRGRIRASKS